MPNNNPTGKGGFKKNDPRINRKGRPKSFDKLRALAQQIAHEEAMGKDGKTVVVNGHKVTVTEAILRQWASSKNPKLQQLFMEVTYGKVPSPIELTGKDGKDLQPIAIINMDATKLKGGE
ncbi:MAG: hypothetical protein GY938_27015 [Ketobacter sp.]|nr:hypothetical protein [Ketobacter sp.]